MKNKSNKLGAIYLSFIMILTGFTIVITDNTKADIEEPFVSINIEPHSILYEGDIINCTITGNPTIKYWMINNQSQHFTFYNDSILLFDPEPTPLNSSFVNLTIYVENQAGSDSATVEVMIKRLFFGDIHWHTKLTDGMNTIDQMYSNAFEDRYLDFAACTDHSLQLDLKLNQIRSVFMLVPMLYCGSFKQILRNRIYGINEWDIVKEKAIEYYKPGRFTTLLGYEWTASDKITPGGKAFSDYGSEDVGHINFYYRDVYPDAKEYTPNLVHTYDDILEKMNEEWKKGHLNFGLPHHPLANAGSLAFNLVPMKHTTNWTFLANNLENNNMRDKIIRGVEMYSRWGTAIGKYSGVQISWPYPPEKIFDQQDSWVENAMWEWSENEIKNGSFVMTAASDTHEIDRPGSAVDGGKIKKYDLPSGIVSAYSVHNTREEIWDSLYNGDMYASQLLKIRANVKFEGNISYGKWINCTGPLDIQISAQSTFSGEDSSGMKMCPHGYSSDELDYPIKDIWVIKKDTVKGRPWCKVISHLEPDEETTVINLQDPDVQPNDFYYVLIGQEGDSLIRLDDSIEEGNKYTAFIGPIFINSVD